MTPTDHREAIEKLVKNLGDSETERRKWIAGMIETCDLLTDEVIRLRKSEFMAALASPTIRQSAEVTAALKLVANGMTAYAAAKKTGIALSTIYRAIKRQQEPRK